MSYLIPANDLAAVFRVLRLSVEDEEMIGWACLTLVELESCFGFLRKLHVDNPFNGEQIAKALAIFHAIRQHVMLDQPFRDVFVSPFFDHNERMSLKPMHVKLEHFLREDKLQKKKDIHGVLTYLESLEPHLSDDDACARQLCPAVSLLIDSMAHLKNVV